MRNDFSFFDKVLINFYIMTEKCAGKLKVIISAIPLHAIAQMCKEKKISLFPFEKCN